jgi:hypothetical protein
VTGPYVPRTYGCELSIESIVSTESMRCVSVAHQAFWRGGDRTAAVQDPGPLIRGTIGTIPQRVRLSFGYVRVSTEDQADNGISLEEQRSRIKAYATAHGLELVRIRRTRARAARRYRDAEGSEGRPKTSTAPRPAGPVLQDCPIVS